MQFDRDETCAEARDFAEMSDDGKNIVKDDVCGSSSSLADSSDSSSSFQDDDDDSVELSESESITDVTPLNSPYCDSPMPQAKDRHQLEACRSTESQEAATDHGEMNVLMQAIEKLEVEKSRRTRKQRGFSGDSVPGNRKPEPENQRLFKQAISQQNRAKKASHDRLSRRSTVINRYKISLDADSPVPPDDASMEANARKSSRKQKCLSHPSCQPYPYPLPESQHPCGLASKTIMHRPNASTEAAPDIESEMIAH